MQNYFAAIGRQKTTIRLVGVLASWVPVVCGFVPPQTRKPPLWGGSLGGRCLPFVGRSDYLIAEGLFFDVVKLIGKASKILEIPAIFLHRQQY